MNLSSPRRRNLLAAPTALAAAVLAGCYTPGGSGFSTDTHTYVSTSWLPCTITIKDNRTGQAIWSADVPVGKQLVINFREGDGIKGSDTPDLMEWEILDAGEMFGQLDNSVPVPRDRIIDPSYRPAPEFPAGSGGTASAGTPASPGAPGEGNR